MAIKLDEQKKRDPITTTLTLPVGKHMLEEYREIAKRLESKELRSLHSFTRERLGKLLEELRTALDSEIKKSG